MRQDLDKSELDIAVVPEYRPKTVNTSRINTAPPIIPDIRPQQRARINAPRIDPAHLIIPRNWPEENVRMNNPRATHTNPVESVRPPRPQLDETASDASSAIMMDIVYQLILAIQYILMTIRYRILGIPATLCIVWTIYSTCVLFHFNTAKDDESRRSIALNYKKMRIKHMACYYTSKLAVSIFISLIVFLFTSNVISGLWMASLGIDIKSGKYEKYANLIDIVTILLMLLPVILVVYQMFAKAKVATMNQVNIEGFDG